MTRMSRVIILIFLREKYHPHLSETALLTTISALQTVLSNVRCLRFTVQFNRGSASFMERLNFYWHS